MVACNPFFLSSRGRHAKLERLGVNRAALGRGGCWPPPAIGPAPLHVCAKALRGRSTARIVFPSPDGTVEPVATVPRRGRRPPPAPLPRPLAPPSSPGSAGLAPRARPPPRRGCGVWPASTGGRGEQKKGQRVSLLVGPWQPAAARRSRARGARRPLRTAAPLPAQAGCLVRLSNFVPSPRLLPG